MRQVWVVYFMEVRKKNWAYFISVLLVFLNIFAWLVVWEFQKPALLEVIFFDVGQGDAIFIQTPKRNQILIDGGPDTKILEKLAKEIPLWDRSIDLVILTHPEKDHLSGLIEVLNRYQVKNILWTGVKRDTSEFKEWEKLIKKEKARVFTAKAGQEISDCRPPRENFCIKLSILYPFEDLGGQQLKDSNNTSVVAKLSFGENKFLFTGDIYKKAEKELIAKGMEITANVLKVGHHGSKTSSGEEFIVEVSPKISVVSLGKNNSYNHPHPETLEVLSNYGIKVLRTDQLGDIKIISDGKNYRLK